MLYNGHNICTIISCNSASLHKTLSPEQCQGDCDMPVNHGLEGTACEVAVGENVIGTKQVNMVPELEFQACNICPKNFLIFDQNDSKSRMIFHPALTDKDATLGFCDMWTLEDHDESKESSFKEDTRDIDALLSSDEGEEEEEISTGRSPWEHDSGKSPDGLSMTTSRDTSKAELSHFYEQNPEAACIDSQCTDQMVQKMIEALRQIIPGGERMDPMVVLDEALRYLKLLKMEVKQLGLG